MAASWWKRMQDSSRTFHPKSPRPHCSSSPRQVLEALFQRQLDSSSAEAIWVPTPHPPYLTIVTCLVFINSSLNSQGTLCHSETQTHFLPGRRGIW